MDPLSRKNIGNVTANSLGELKEHEVYFWMKFVAQWPKI